MREYGLIGYPLGHSFSEKYFREKFAMEGITDCSYFNFPLTGIGELSALLATHSSLRGFNVTIPYKEQVLPYLTSIDPEARAIGAVNCVRIENGKLTGHNTDAYGFRLSLMQLIGDERPSALVLGTGGASKAVIYVLRELGIDYAMVSRTPASGQFSYDDLNEAIISARRLIINTTPLGTFPNVNTLPDIPYDYLSEGHFLFDVVYNPAVSAFLAQGLARRASVLNGRRMLGAQAERSWEIWSTEDSR